MLNITYKTVPSHELFYTALHLRRGYSSYLYLVTCTTQIWFNLNWAKDTLQ